ncbi:MAG: hypothetical protein ACRD3S_09515 [Terracidiphilus sp.]
MNEPADFNAPEDHAEPPQPAVVRPRTAGSPLSAGANRHDQQDPVEENRQRFDPRQAPQAPEEEAANAPEFPSIQRAAGFVRSAVPILQRLLPLLDGNFATVVGNLIAARTNAQAARSSSKIDLTPIEDSLVELRSQQYNIRLELTEQNISLKAVEDQLQTVREVTSRSMIEQQEALEDLKAAAKRVTVIAVIALLLAAAGLATAVALFLQTKKMLP